MLKAAVPDAIKDKPLGAFTYRGLAAAPDRHRGFWNFLTWPFLMAEIVVADLFFGKGLHAAEELDFPSRHATDQFSPELDESRTFGTQSSEGPELTQPDLLDYADQTAAQPSLSESPTTIEAQVLGGASGGVPAGSGGSGGGTGSAIAPVDPEDIGETVPIGQSLVSGDLALSLSLDESGASVQLKIAVLLDIGLDVSLVDLALDLDLDPLLRLDDSTELGLEIESGEASIHVAFDGLSALADDVIAGGTMSFSESANASVATDELFVGGRYTQYHMALQSTPDASLPSAESLLGAQTFGVALDLSSDAQGNELHPNGSPFSDDKDLDGSLVTVSNLDDKLDARDFMM